MKKLWQKVHDWWKGEIVVYRTRTRSKLIDSYIKRHWTSWLAHKILGFLSREWKWVAGFAVGVASVMIAWLQLSQGQ